MAQKPMTDAEMRAYLFRTDPAVTAGASRERGASANVEYAERTMNALLAIRKRVRGRRSDDPLAAALAADERQLSVDLVNRLGSKEDIEFAKHIFEGGPEEGYGAAITGKTEEETVAAEAASKAREQVRKKKKAAPGRSTSVLTSNQEMPSILTGN
jgi:hypothetical protein